MRLYEIEFTPRVIIPSENSDELSKEIDELVMFIKRHCQPWLKQSGNRMVYRGTEAKTSAPAFVKPVRKDRKPRDSTQAQHEFMNKIISICGGVANRSNSAFVTGDSFVTGYGDIYVVFPVGDFHYTWSKKVYDFYDFDWGEYYKLDELKVKYKPIYDKIISYYNMDDYKNSEEEILKKYKKQIDNAFAHEMYLITRRSPESIQWSLDNYDLDKIKKHKLFICDQGLEQAIESEHEIMVACDQLLYIKSDFFERHLSHLDTMQS
jgi:hypothetical protein